MSKFQFLFIYLLLVLGSSFALPGLLFILLHPALCPEKLISVNCITGSLIGVFVFFFSSRKIPAGNEVLGGERGKMLIFFWLFPARLWISNHCIPLQRPFLLGTLFYSFRSWQIPLISPFPLLLQPRGGSSF